MAFGGGGNKGVKNEINVTPLVDVCLVLLIIFMVITPMLQRGKPVKLPSAHKIDEEKSTDPIVVSMTLQKELYVESDRSNDADLIEKVKTALEKEPTRKVLFKADTGLTVADVRPVMNNLKLAGSGGVALGVEQEKK
ncbi:biopolymer transporter ExbD [Pendulispora brunnea]|uniref:Biopolymer transporter ExbD n=1 Tax=Pendulispora brunnea TaxID=2905690 RepID=A0ABZ2K338_9BACT